MTKDKPLIWLGAILMISLLFAGCVAPTPEEITKPKTAIEEEREYLVEQVGNLAVYRIYADGFEDLSIEDQLLAYWLTQAAIAGRDIFYHQMHSQGLDISRVLEGVLSAPEGIEEGLLQEIKHYAYRVWDSSSNYDQRTFKKFLPEFTYDELVRAAHRANENDGAGFELKEGEALDELLDGVRKAMFDPGFDAYLKNQEAEDIVKESAANFYDRGVTENKVVRFYDSGKGKNPLNSRVARKWFRLEEQVYKVGGLYSEEIEQIIYYLEKAKPYCPENQAECLDLLIEYYRSGDLVDFEKFNIAWVQTNPEVDFINGFIEVYQDPLGLKGSWEGLVNFINKEKTETVQKIIDEVQYYEDSMPWKSDYKKVWKEKPVAKSVSVVSEIGDAATCCVIGINLPNSQKIREEYGSKSIALDNVVEDLDRGKQDAYGVQVLEEFALPDEWEAASKWVSQADWVALNFHEIIGHGSGKASESLAKDPSFYIKGYYNTLEETRAELVALYFLPDDKTIELGLLPSKDAAWAYYRDYARSDLQQLRRFETGNVIGEAHNQATHLIVQYLISKGEVEVKQIDGKHYYVVKDPVRMREALGELLAEVQAVKSEGSYEGAKHLVETYGKYLDEDLRDEVIERYSNIEIPKYSVVVMPWLVPTHENGRVVDVSIDSNESYMEQQLRYSRYN